jgi:hypothetical protein
MIHGRLSPYFSTKHQLNNIPPMRPPFRRIGSSEEFDQWYWSREELEEICAYLGLPARGSIPDLRRRIILEMDEPESQARPAPDPSSAPPGAGDNPEENT